VEVDDDVAEAAEAGDVETIKPQRRPTSTPESAASP
jgi:hypothetical protein